MRTVQNSRRLNPNKVIFINFKNPDMPSRAEPYPFAVLGGRLKNISPSIGIKTINADIDPHFFQSIGKSISEERPILIGLRSSLGSLSDISQAISIINEASGLPHPGIVIGGQIASYLPEKVFSLYPRAFVVAGEGEEAIDGLYKHALGQTSLDRIPNLFYFDANGIRSTFLKSFDPEKAVLPYRPPEETAALISMGAAFIVETSRGCHWGRCTFCPGGDITSIYQNERGPNYKEFSVDHVISQFESLAEMGVKNIQISDPDFSGGNSQRSRAVAEALIKSGNAINFKLTIRADALFNRLKTPAENREKVKTFNMLKRAGLDKVFLGLESLVPTQRKRYFKGILLEDNLRCLGILKTLGLDIEVGWIPIDPLMTLEEAEENVRLGVRFGIYPFAPKPLNMMRLHYGVPYVKMAEEAGLSVGPPEDNYLWHSYTFEPGTFKDERVRSVALSSAKWYNETHHLYYGIKNILRTGNLPPKEMVALGRILEDFKKLDIDFIYSMINVEREKSAYKNNVLAHFKLRKKLLIEKLIGLCKNNVITNSLVIEELGNHGLWAGD